MRERSAKGTNGMLISDMNGGFYFRVYHSNGEFTDYDIRHCDMAIEITDEDAYFKLERSDNPVIDYSNQTLGRK